MFYAAQLEDGDERIATILEAEDDECALKKVEQWLDLNEWEPESVWQNLTIWRLGDQISHQVLNRTFWDTRGKE